MIGTYKPYLLITLEHEYAPPPDTVSVKIDPSPATKYWLEQRRMLVRQLADGLCILADHSFLEELPAEHATTLQFRLFSNDRLFRNYTAITPALTSVGPEANLFEITLTNAEADIAPTLNAENWQSLSDLSTNTQLDGLTSRDQQQDLISWLNVSLTPSCIGTLSTQIILRFSARKARWKYLFMDSFSGNEYRIHDINQTFNFEYTGTIELLNGRSSITFTSTQPILIYRLSPYQFQLRKNDKILIRRLPVANPSLFEKSAYRQEDPLTYSIFVT